MKNQYPRIGNISISSPVFLAPMAGVNCTAFRLMCHNYGAGLVYTQMIDSDDFFEKDILGKPKARHIDFIKEERPIAAQLIGNDPKKMAEAASSLQEHADIIDINLGCIEGDFLGKKSGCYLMKHPDKISKIISRVSAAINRPVTVKMRSGWDKDSIDTPKLAKTCEDAGAAAVCIHPRTRKQRYMGKSDWNIIKQVKNSINIPVIGNGDIDDAYKARRMIQLTGCDFVMAGRAAKGNPFIFDNIKQYLLHDRKPKTITEAERGKAALEFIDLYNKVQPIKRFTELKDHLMWFCNGIKFAKTAKQALKNAESESEFKGIIKKYCR